MKITLPSANRRNGPGRPSTTDTYMDIRYALIKSSQNLFSNMPYDKVSTRLIAEKAGVSSSLIRYYFGGKEGLFETAVVSLCDSFFIQISKLIESTTCNNFSTFIFDVMQEIKKAPQLPKIMSHTLSLEKDNRYDNVVNIVLNSFNELYDKLVPQLQTRGILDTNMNPELSKVSIINLLLHPFNIPQTLLSAYSLESNGDFYEKVIEKNIELIIYGTSNFTPSLCA
ncbi:TetR/AcrR family transcriptional regulator [Vibrio marisflavi]|uniref:HTH tetR-type domain-containing protein n=1 Tax=Vibrio marisflavi CECT 7928 TaxID=634439 RepID=A0ABM9A656_9VIBR|nr:TetR/AcrR family transcriptional regulator [Vibrio marisflavi]CAH0540446.1 hypothetical protein VMF7928_02865 [Vibrio marisflavi CECT 7928]